jgi:hypothetical protein
MGEAVQTSALPIMERRDASIWEEAEQRRDALFAAFEDECRERGYEAAVLKSRQFEQPAWVSIEAWVPSGDDGATRRRFATIKIFAKAFHKHKFEYTVALGDGEWTRTHGAQRTFERDDLSDVVAFVLGATSKPPKYKVTWRANQVNVLKRDPLGVNRARTGRPKRRPVVLSSGKPKAEPRSLVLIDTWQAMISGLGADVDDLRERFLGALAASPIADSAHRVERIWYWGLDGTVEREQIVVTLRRGIVFCHIYPYDRELYVGWDAHLNAGQWVEKTVARGKSKDTGEYTTVKTVVSGVQRLTEYDLIDVSCLSEWIHNQLVRLVQRLMKERQIDQEIDFKIIRGNRQGLAGMGNEEGEKPAGRSTRTKVTRTG